jgi:predicted dehydrogenase
MVTTAGGPVRAGRAPAAGWRWGIAGCGWIARDHVVPAMAAAGHELVAALDPDPGAARALAPSALATADADEFFACELDAVYVAAPNHAHRDLVEQAARAGRHVLCEKPMALTLADAEAMVAACEQAGVRYATAHNQRFHPAHVAMREAIAAGVLGTPTQVAVHYACSCPPWWAAGDWHFDERTAGGGALFDLAPHGIDLAGVLTGTEPAEVVALRQRAVLEHPVEDGGIVTLRLVPGDVLAVVQVSYARPEALPRRILRVDGTAGCAIATDTMGQTPGGTVELLFADGRREPLAFDPAGDPFRAQLEAFATGRSEPAGRDLRVMAALEAAMTAEGRSLERLHH